RYDFHLWNWIRQAEASLVATERLWRAGNLRSLPTTKGDHAMNVLKSFWTAIGELAASMTNLAATINGISSQLRQRAGLGDPLDVIEADRQAEPAALPSGRKRPQ